MFQSFTINNFGVFEKFQWESIGNMNVIIGENDTGKSSLLKMLYSISRSHEEYVQKQTKENPNWKDILSKKLLYVFQPGTKGLWKLGSLVRNKQPKLTAEFRFADENYHFSFGPATSKSIVDASRMIIHSEKRNNSLFFPPKEVLTNLKAIYSTKSLENGFDDTYIDLIEALLMPTVQGKYHKVFKQINDDLETLFKGKIVFENDDFWFKRGNEVFKLTQVAEGIKKCSLLTHLFKNRQINRNTILFFDEPEVNLHPRALVLFVEMLYMMSTIGVQIFIATHSYFVVKKLELLARKEESSVNICSLPLGQKKNGSIEFSDLRNGMPDNPILDVSSELYSEEVHLSLHHESA